MFTSSNMIFGMTLPIFPIADWVEAITEWLTVHLSQMFTFIEKSGNALMEALNSVLTWIPPAILITLVAILAYYATGKKWHLPTFTLIGLGFVLNQGLWTDLMQTVSLVLVASLVSIIIGVPLGIFSAKFESVHTLTKPILDFMQTMPAFVYLIPAVAFFGIGMVPGVFASVIFALPPTVRFTELGIKQISDELIEAADAFGSTPWQKLTKVELPLAQSTIMAGINQTVMLALSMVVTGSMIGAPGLGRIVLSALQRSQVGNGFVAGLSIVVLAIIVDRLTNALTSKDKE